MDKSVIGSEYELSLRLLLLLDVYSPSELDEQQICAVDFIAIYAADFGLMDENLHGNSNYRYSEYPARKQLITSVLKRLVLERYALLQTTPKGYKYAISETGHNACQSLSSSYAEEYQIALQAVKDRFDNGSFSLMEKEIDRLTTRSISEGTYE